LLFALERLANQLYQHGLRLAVRLGREGGNARFEIRREGECQLHARKFTAEGMARLADVHHMQFGAVKAGILSGSMRRAVDGAPDLGVRLAELRPPPERNHFRNHLSETRGDGPTRPVTVSP
jgi:hypothetical protein